LTWRYSDNSVISKHRHNNHEHKTKENGYGGLFQEIRRFSSLLFNVKSRVFDIYVRVKLTVYYMFCHTLHTCTVYTCKRFIMKRSIILLNPWIMCTWYKNKPKHVDFYYCNLQKCGLLVFYNNFRVKNPKIYVSPWHLSVLIFQVKWSGHILMYITSSWFANVTLCLVFVFVRAILSWCP